MFEEIGQFPKVAFEMEEDSSMAGLVAQGFGIAVMPDIPILRSLSVKTLDIYNPPYERAVYLATLKQRYLSPVAKAFIRFVIEETAYLQLSRTNSMKRLIAGSWYLPVM